MLLIVFGEDPPVYSKVAAPPRPAYPPTTPDGNTPSSPPGGRSPLTHAMEPPCSNNHDELQQQTIASLLSMVGQLQLVNDEKDARIKVLEARIDDLEEYSQIEELDH